MPNRIKANKKIKTKHKNLYRVYVEGLKKFYREGKIYINKKKRTKGVV